ncbi:MAG: hypothetical protein JNL96_15595 [Planctomycetaceae bacterium]|nr:hypothetical protein [Planctomycetaceae bacterium]
MEDLDVSVLEASRRLSREDRDADRPVFAEKRADNPLADHIFRNGSGREFGLFAQVDMQRRRSAAPTQQLLELRFGEFMFAGMRNGRRTTLSGRYCFNDSSSRIESTNNDKIDGQSLEECRRGERHGLANFKMPAGLSPNAEQEWCETFHVLPFKYDGRLNVIVFLLNATDHSSLFNG